MIKKFIQNSLNYSLLILLSCQSIQSSPIEAIGLTGQNEKTQLIINDKSYEADSIQLVGGKAASLYHLQQVPQITIPKWFCLTTVMFKRYLEMNHLDEEVRKLDELSQRTAAAPVEEKKAMEKAIYAQAVVIRNRIIKGEILEEFGDEIKREYKKLIDSCGYTPPVAVRSSGIIEDMPESSFAGIYDTFLNQKDEESILSSVKECWASVFNDRAVFERNSRNIKHRDALTGVIVQQMIEAKVAGTAFNMEIGTGYSGIEIAANYGLGESVVGGEVSVDKWLVHPTTNRIIKSTLGNKKFKVLSDSHKSGVEIIPSTELEKEIYVLDHKMVQEISSQVKEIAKHYFNKFSYSHIDTEFAVDKNDRLYFLQARPLVTVSMQDFRVLDKEDAKSHRLIAKGRFSVPGVACGKVKVIPSWEDLAEGQIVIEPDDIAVTYVSTNYWSQYMTNFKGMITQEGGPTSHPILLCRERKVPCVIGLTQEAFKNLTEYDGKYVTIDGINQLIYEGEVKLKAASPEDFNSQFEIAKEEEFPFLGAISERTSTVWYVAG